MAKIEGGCLCGAVRYKADVEPIAVINCYCHTCKKNSGSTHSWNLMIAKGSVPFSGDALKVFEDRSGASGKVFERRFCGNCGSHLISGGAAYGDVEFIKAGTLGRASLAHLDGRETGLGPRAGGSTDRSQESRLRPIGRRFASADIPNAR